MRKPPLRDRGCGNLPNCSGSVKKVHLIGVVGHGFEEVQLWKVLPQLLMPMAMPVILVSFDGWIAIGILL